MRVLGTRYPDVLVFISVWAGWVGKVAAMAENSTADVKPETGTRIAEADANGDVPRSEREDLASKLVVRFATWSGVAGLVPLPVLDIAAIGALQLELLRRISKIYDVPFSENSGKAVTAALAGCLIPAASGLGAASALKFVPIVGMLADVFVMPALSAGATYGIGKAFIQHFETGGTLLDFNPPDYRDFVRAQKEKWDARSSRRARQGVSTPGQSERTETAETATTGS
jgi:uncharacterized protein (DUF697 family)